MPGFRWRVPGPGRVCRVIPRPTLHHAETHHQTGQQPHRWLKVRVVGAVGYFFGAAAALIALSVAVSVSKFQMPTSKKTSAARGTLCAVAKRALICFGRLALALTPTSLSMTGTVVNLRICENVAPKTLLKVAVFEPS